MSLFRRAKKMPRRGRKTLSPDGLRVVEFSPGLASQIRLGGLDSYSAIFQTQPAVFGTVNFLARNVAQLGLKVYLRKSNTDRLEMPDHALKRTLDDPNDEESGFELKYNVVADLAVFDRAYILKVVVPGADKAGLVRLPPTRVTHVSETLMGPTAFRVTYPNGRQEVYKRDQVIYMHGYSPDTNARGEPALEALRLLLIEDFAASKARATFWKTGGHQDYVIERPLEAPAWDDDGELRFIEKWFAQTAATTDTADKFGVLDEGMTLKERNSQNARNAEFVAGRVFAYETVARIFQIPPGMVGLLAAGTGFGSISEQHKMLYQDALGPVLEKFQAAIEKQLLPEFEAPGNGVYVEFNLAEKLKGSFEEQASSLVSLIGRPVLTGNEGRGRLNLNRVEQPDMDAVILPLNVIAGGQPAPTVPTDVPKPDAQTPVKPGAQASVSAKAKLAGDEMAQLRDKAAEEHGRRLAAFFERQRRSVKSSGSLGEERWNGELAKDLHEMMLETTALIGQWAAKAIGGTYDVDRTSAYWQAEAEQLAAGLNAKTSAQLAVADSDADAVFDARVGESPVLAMQRATRGASWAVMECARQNGAG